jgi:hypothetical protein
MEFAGSASSVYLIKLHFKLVYNFYEINCLMKFVSLKELEIGNLFID